MATFVSAFELDVETLQKVWPMLKEGTMQYDCPTNFRVTIRVVAYASDGSAKGKRTKTSMPVAQWRRGLMDEP